VIIFVTFNYLVLRLVLAVVESLYYYLRLYTNARRKRTVYRNKVLAKYYADNEAMVEAKKLKPIFIPPPSPQRKIYLLLSSMDIYLSNINIIM
jgi:hypothetical protein